MINAFEAFQSLVDSIFITIYIGSPLEAKRKETEADLIGIRIVNACHNIMIFCK